MFMGEQVVYHGEVDVTLCSGVFLGKREPPLALIMGRALEETAEGRAGPREPLRWRLQ